MILGYLFMVRLDCGPRVGGHIKIQSLDDGECLQVLGDPPHIHYSYARLDSLKTSDAHPYKASLPSRITEGDKVKSF